MFWLWHIININEKNRENEREREREKEKKKQLVQRKQKLLLRNMRYKYCIGSYIVQTMAQ